MSEQKVAIVTDNNQGITKRLIAKYSQEFANIKVFDFSELYSEEFKFWRLQKLVYKLENLDLSEFDRVISISAGFANGIVTNIDCFHENVFVDFPTWYFMPDTNFLKLKFRAWLALATERPEENLFATNFLRRLLSKVNPLLAESELVGKIKYVPLESFVAPEEVEGSEKSVVMIAGNPKSLFLDAVAGICNKTGKKLVIVGDKQVQSKNSFFSEYVQFVSIENVEQVQKLMREARGIAFDQYFRDFDFLSESFMVKVPVLSYRNDFISEFFNEGVFKLNNIDSFENDFAKFISWSKIVSAPKKKGQVKKGAEMKKLTIEL